MSEYHQSDEELVQHVNEQMRFLRASAKQYDDGDLAEAKRLAVIVRLLLHDTNASHSLLGLLRVKQHLRFVDTAGPLPELAPDRVRPNGQIETHRMSSCPLAPLRIHVEGEETSGTFLARGDTLDGAHAPKEFDDWWEAPIARDFGNQLLTRKSVVLALANKDGGAHVGPVLPAVWASMTRGEPFFRVIVQGETMPPLNPAPPIMRQIAFEVGQTLMDQFEAAFTSR